MKSTPRLLLPLFLVCLVLLLPATAFAGDDWRPVDPADLALKTPVVEKDADAEAIFWEVRLSDEVEGGTFSAAFTKNLDSPPRTVLRHYLAVRSFFERIRAAEQSPVVLARK